jgi:hypothetical protein
MLERENLFRAWHTVSFYSFRRLEIRFVDDHKLRMVLGWVCKKPVGASSGSLWEPIESGELPNPRNYFAQAEQAAFSPINIVPGPGYSPDKMLYAHLISYLDAHRYCLGVNFEALPAKPVELSDSLLQSRRLCAIWGEWWPGAELSANRFDQSTFDSNSYGFRTAHGIQLCQDGFYVRFYRVLADIERLPDLLVASAISHVFQHL